MTRLLTRTGSSLPLWFDDIPVYASIATADYDPLATYQASAKATTDLSLLGTFIDHGFGVCNATDNSGVIYAITFDQFEAYKKSHKGTTAANYTYAGIVPREIYLTSGQWCLTPVVKVFADNDANYKSTVTTINVGRIL